MSRNRVLGPLDRYRTDNETGTLHLQKDGAVFGLDFVKNTPENILAGLSYPLTWYNFEDFRSSFKFALGTKLHKNHIFLIIL